MPIKNKKFGPLINKSRAVKKFQIKTDDNGMGYYAILSDNIEHRGFIGYMYTFKVYRTFKKNNKKKILFWITSEKQFFGHGYVLGAFKDDSHHNFGKSDDYADMNKFLGHAFVKSKEFLNIKTNGWIEIKFN